MTEAEPRILVVEDERHLSSGLKLNFELEGYAVDVAETAREAGNLLVRSGRYDAILLDIMLPDLDGFALCEKLRAAGNFTPVIMLTARGSAIDRVRGLEVGADDYVAKPFDLKELLARVRSVLRRRGWDRDGAAAPARELSFGRARVNFDSHAVTVDGRAIALTQLEIDLLRFFADNAGRVVSRAELLEKVWKLRNAPNTRSVDNFIGRLRKHFESDADRPVHFIAVRGAGYRFQP
ncbi:MAG: response regulator transcription factor [Deltaproteobacteria bacterium]|nr:response regulator transcription factor [Deltaproteobacteria bacterium]